MPKRTIMLIGIIGLIAVILVIAAFVQMTKNSSPADEPAAPSKNDTTQKIETTPVEKKVLLSFDPQQVTSASFPTTKANIIVDTGGENITGVQVELEYDPTKITRVSILPPTTNSLFGTSGQELINTTRPEAGRISYALVISPSANEVKGIGSVGILEFQAVSGAVGTTEIKFLEKSLATSLRSKESVLKATTPLTITLSSSSSAGIQIQSPSPTIPPVQ